MKEKEVVGFYHSDSSAKDLAILKTEVLHAAESLERALTMGKLDVVRNIANYLKKIASE